MNAQDIEKSLLQQIADDEASHVRHSKAVEALRRHDGKTITRRLNRDLEKIGARLSFRYGMIHVTFQGPGMEVRDHLLAYDTCPQVDLAKFEDFDACHGRAALVRNIERRSALARVEKAAEAFLAFEKAAKDFSLAVDGMGSEASEVTAAAKEVLHGLFYWRIS